MALDLGEKTIGVALSDPSGILAQPLVTIRRRHLRADLGDVAALVEKHDVKELVIGLPLNMDGSQGPMAEAALEFSRRLRGAIRIPIHTWDERLSTVAAERALLEGDVRRKKRREVIDQVAAAMILESWLAGRKTKAPPPEESAP